MEFKQLLARADQETLREIVGPAATSLLVKLDPDLAKPSSLRHIVERTSTPGALLRDKATRNLLIATLPNPDAADLAGRLGMPLDSGRDPYAFLASLSIRKGSKRDSDLHDYFGIKPDSGSQDNYAPIKISTVPVYPLFPHQKSAIRAVKSILNGRDRRAVLHMPTGSGKTRTTMSYIADTLREENRVLVVWLAYSEELCDQAASEFETAWAALGDRNVSLTRFYGSRSLDTDADADGLLVCGLDKLRALLQRDYAAFTRIADLAALVVIDEAHQSLAPTYRRLLSMLTTRHRSTKLLGLTATPGRTWNDPDEDRRLAEFFGSQKVTLQVEGYSNPVTYLIDRGYLARTSFESLHYGGGTKLSETDLENIANSSEIPKTILDELAEDDARNLLIISRLEQLTRLHFRIIVFATTVEHAETIATALVAREHKASAVTSNTSENERRKRIAEFKSSDRIPRIIVNYGVLTTGFDAPQTSVALIARPTKSLVLYSQMVGRATRGQLAGGNSVATVVTVVDTRLPGFGDMAEAFTNWEDVWE